MTRSAPKTVAVIGATGPGTLGDKTLAGLAAGGFDRPLVAVDSREQPNAFGIPVYRTLEDVRTPVDLAVVVTNSDDTLDEVRKCVAAEVKGVVVLAEMDGPAGRS
jgi:acyl-CoA synthetase (NDP forming)